MYQLINTQGPQVDRILQKSIKLFPTIDSSSMEDVVSSYDWLQELTPMFLLGLMPFDAIVLRNWFEGLCISRLGIV